MKCIVYASEVVARKNGAMVPVGLSSIFGVARKKNVEFDITGIMSFRKGRYFQVIEGQDEHVDQLFNNILIDNRHTAIVSLLDMPTSSRFFPDWEMKLAESIHKVPEFQQFIRHHAALIHGMPSDKRTLLDNFIRPAKMTQSGVAASNRDNFDGMELRLTTWPDFNKVGQSPKVYDLCAQLIRRTIAYDELIDNKRYGSKENVDQLLHAFQALDILSASTLITTGTRARADARNDGFYFKMKNFLRLV